MAVETTIQLADGGYLGTQATIAEHVKKAQDEIRACQLFIKQGGTEPKQYPATFTLKSVSIVPRED